MATADVAGRYGYEQVYSIEDVRRLAADGWRLAGVAGVPVRDAYQAGVVVYMMERPPAAVPAGGHAFADLYGDSAPEDVR